MLPSELFQAHTAVEYVLQQPVLAPPAFVFVVDLAVCNHDELEVHLRRRHVLYAITSVSKPVYLLSVIDLPYSLNP